MSHSIGENSAFAKPVRVLVVDDDSTCLSIVDAMLKRWNYEVVAVKHPIDALSILRTNKGSFDIVVLDVHMPAMSGFELQQLITEEFNLPVVLMSADNKEAIILKGIEGGAVYFISKPVNPDDVKDLWQFASVTKKINNELSTGTKNDNGQGKGKEKTIADNHDKGNSDGNESSVNIKDQENDEEIKRKYSIKAVDDSNGKGDIAVYSTSKKQKIVWTSELHNRFLEAISNIGLERAVPKKILEEMNVPGLTRENVASHLQKYRIFLKRLADLSSVNFTREKSFSDRFFRSSFMSKNSSPTFDKFRQHQLKTLYSSRGYEPYSSPTLNSSNLINSDTFPILETSSTNLLSSGHAQSSLSSNQDISMQMYNHVTQSKSNILRHSLEPNYNNLRKFGVGSSESAFATSGTSSSNYSNNLNIQNPNSFGNSNYVGFGNQFTTESAQMGSSNYSNNLNIQKPNSFSNSNYVGFGNQITTESGQMGFISAASNGFIYNKGKAFDANIYQNYDKLNSTSIPGNAVWNNGSAGEVDSDALFGNLMNNGTASTSNTTLPQALQPYDSGRDFTSEVANQEQGREDADFWSSFGSFGIGDMDVPMVQQFTDQQQQAGSEPMVIASNSSSSSSNIINQLNAYSPWINQNLMSQRDDEAFLDSVLSMGPDPSASPYDQAN